MNRIATLLTTTYISRGGRKAKGPKRNGKNKPAKRQGKASSCAPKANKVEELSRKHFFQFGKQPDGHFLGGSVIRT